MRGGEEEGGRDCGRKRYVPHKPSIFDRPARPYTEVLEEEARKEEAKEKQEAPSIRGRSRFSGTSEDAGPRMSIMMMKMRTTTRK